MLTVDNLYRAVGEAVYGERDDVDPLNKPAGLAFLQADGFWLIDAVHYPVNKLSNSARLRAIEESGRGSSSGASSSRPSAA